MIKDPSVIIIGSGPGGFYAAEAITKKLNSDIDIIDRLPTPFGLIRGGVAPDHQNTKKIIARYTKTAKKEQVRFFGNIEIGRDFTIEELRNIYDVVILATGLELDKKLEIKGSDLKGVFGSAEFVGWYNGNPDFVNLKPNLNTENVVVIGNGNVAIDIVRILNKTPQEMAESDIPNYALKVINQSPIKKTYIVGRRGPVQAKFTNVELRELGSLKSCNAEINIKDLPKEIDGNFSDRDKRLIEKNLETLRNFSMLSDKSKERKINFIFFHKPIEIIGDENVNAIKFEKVQLENSQLKETGEFMTINCELVITAIGHQSKQIQGLEISNGVAKNSNGKIDTGLYAVGWIRRGPIGVIATNKVDGEIVVEQIIKEFTNQKKNGRASLIEMIKSKNLEVTNFQDWEKIDSFEKKNTKGSTPRKKILSIKEMLNICKI